MGGHDKNEGGGTVADLSFFQVSGDIVPEKSFLINCAADKGTKKDWG